MDIESYYTVNYSLMQYHKWSITELENMIPWEKDIYINLLMQELEMEREKARLESQGLS